VSRPSSDGRALAYVALVYGWTWSFWWGAILLGAGWSSVPGALLFAVGGAGPVLAAALLVQLGHHPDTPRQFWRRLVSGRHVPYHWWWGLAVLAVLPAVGARLVDGTGPWVEVGAVAVLVTGLVAGVLEEPGWRGYAQDVLQRRHGPLGASLLVGPVWALWHLPLFFFVGSYQHEQGRWNESFVLFMGGVVAWAVVYALVYVGTGRSILAVVVLHAAANGAGELVPSDGSGRVELVVVAALALLSAWALHLRSMAVGAGRSCPRSASGSGQEDRPRSRR
jgi:uncharacterized protein